MNNSTVFDLIQQENIELEELKSQNKNRAKRFKVLTIIFLVVFAISIIAGIAISRISLKKRYAQLIDASDSGTIDKYIDLFDKEILKYDNGLLLYQYYFLGNDNRLITTKSGKECRFNEGIIKSENGVTTYINGDKNTVVVEKDVSYINRYEDGLIFIDDESNKIYKSDLNNLVEVLQDYSVKELIVSENNLFFINSKDNTIWYSDDLKTAKQFSEISALQFSFVGKYILAQNDEDELVLINEKGKILKTIKNVDNFIVSEKVYVGFTDGTIISMNYDFSGSKKLCEPKGRLCFVGDFGVYVQSDTSVLLIADDDIQTLAENVEVLKGVTELENGQITLNTVSNGQITLNTVSME